MNLWDCVVGMTVYMPVVVESVQTGEWRHGTIVAEHNPYNAPDTVAVEWDNRHRQLITARSLLTEQEYAQQTDKERLVKMSIKKEDCVIDERVALIGSGTPFRKGKIASPITNNSVIVEFDDGNLKRHDLKNLLNLNDALKEEKRLADLEKTRLEKEFEAERLVAEKVQKASELIDEAAKIARSVGKALMDMDEVGSIESSMERAGWNTSSWHC